ncbi:unnamed protein product [Lepeophtheirus salmonis]|uniref:(salmon louse) hypothetical protein n=1 Tax=Lepeophtheirus salmonis TaxID=72036 RepID=A0A7R8D5X5_LEPSM|nr:unnamed protein product [Lepeophtheirus salmonis]CAF3008754.1 unnamed protein product [Lepeophtheirus salmonis]
MLTQPLVHEILTTSSILVAPEIHMDVRLTQKPLGERVILNATIRGNPPPIVKWKRAGLKIRGGNGRHQISTKVESNGVIFTSLEIISLEKEDDYMQYTCEASNSKGTVFDSIEIHVLDSMIIEDDSENRNDVLFGSSRNKKKIHRYSSKEHMNRKMDLIDQESSNGGKREGDDTNQNSEQKSIPKQQYVPKSMMSGSWKGISQSKNGPSFQFLLNHCVNNPKFPIASLIFFVLMRDPPRGTSPDYMYLRIYHTI